MSPKEKADLDRYITRSDERVSRWSKSQRDAFQEATADLRSEMFCEHTLDIQQDFFADPDIGPDVIFIRGVCSICGEEIACRVESPKWVLDSRS